MGEDSFLYADELGPAKMVHLYVPGAGLKAVVAVDNTACGPAIGGVRMAPDVSAEEAFRLARAMTLKNAAASLPHGGGKSVIFADPQMPLPEKERLLRAFAQAIAGLTEYIPGPDMGTDELAMGWVHDEIGRAVGLPRELGGIPLDELGATGFGLAAAIEVACEAIHVELRGARVAIQGFGAVGKHTARFLAQKGCVLVACSDSRGAVGDSRGLDVSALIALKDSGKSVVDFPNGEKAPADAMLDVPCEIWVPAARPDVLRGDNAGRLQTRIVAQGANIPCTPEAEALLESRGVLILPDFVVNAGGVICAATEYHGGTEASAFASIGEKIRRNTALVIEQSRRQGISARSAATALALERIRRAQRARRWR
ncbi:MAG TPA: Glu/Leu/Phe/Val dehydrogenase [Terriglobia bacterium]|nr:Glu/Leu/Phe/Val dehydrogenase [Terriglobia bacterium]